jgi:hypothetical protein
MKPIVIVQTIEYTSGLFRGKRTERYIKCYSEKEKALYMSFVPVYGSPVKLIKVEVRE